MPRTAVTPQAATSVGSTVTFEPANVDGNSFTPKQGRALHVRNGSASPITVTVPTPVTSDGLSVADRAIVLEAGAHGVFGPGSSAVAGIYAQADGVVYVDYSAVTTVTVAVIDHP